LIDRRLDLQQGRHHVFAPIELIETSALPRLVVERRLRTPGTARTACSIGKVTSIIIRSAGRSRHRG